MVFNCVLIGSFAHVVDAGVAYFKTLQNNRQLNYIYDVNYIHYREKCVVCLMLLCYYELQQHRVNNHVPPNYSYEDVDGMKI